MSLAGYSKTLENATVNSDAILGREIKIIPVSTEEELRQFVALPHKVYANDPFWPGQDDTTELALHHPKTYYPVGLLERQLFLAVKGTDVVGRISAFLNEPHNQRWNQNIGFFGHFECINDPKVAELLLQTAESWVKERQKDEIHGPFSYMYYDIIGVLVQGYKDRPTVGLAYSPEYYAQFMESTGFTKVKDVVEVMAEVQDYFNVTEERFSEIQQYLEDERFKIRTLDGSKLREELISILDIYNDSFSKHWFARTLGPEEWLAIMEPSYAIIPKELFLIVEFCGEPIAFLFLENDYNQVLHSKRHGLDSEKANRVKAYVIGIKYEYQRGGIGKWLLYEAANRLKAMNYKEISFSWIDESNTKSINLATGMGGHIEKIFRIYHKQF